MRIATSIALLLVGCTASLEEVSDPRPPAGGGGSAGSGSGSGTSTMTATAYFSEIADVDCERAFDCKSSYPEMGFDSTFGLTEQDCIARLLVAWSPGAVEADISAGRIAYNGTAAETCVQETEFRVACTEFWATGPRWDPKCYEVLQPKVAVGGACLSDYACTTGLCDLASQRCAP